MGHRRVAHGAVPTVVETPPVRSPSRKRPVSIGSPSPASTSPLATPPSFQAKFSILGFLLGRSLYGSRNRRLHRAVSIDTRTGINSYTSATQERSTPQARDPDSPLT
ncbi:hypothetical protein EW146_g5384 [Bondarzewia mesenterica]|uniref:Uncharacterized protein n=1 Tax=Bondarzewia mesenterica TaxID=1095465 RepID=A0A4S4LRM7_9AGAM|nr:hypothetical protein EW146_g5384 [Bondarzewia mesenterica]